MEAKEVFAGQVKGLRVTLDQHFRSREALERACAELVDSVTKCVQGWTVQGFLREAEAPLNRPAWVQDYRTFREAARKLENLRECWAIYDKETHERLISAQQLDVLHLAQRLAHSLSGPGAVSSPSFAPPRGPVRKPQNGSHL